MPEPGTAITITALQMGPALRAGPVARPAGALGAGGGGPALPAAADRFPRPVDARAPRPPAVRPGTGRRGGRPRAVRIRRDRAADRRAQPGAAAARRERPLARATAWVLAALNTVEPPIADLAAIDFFHADEAWAKARRPRRRGVRPAAPRRARRLARRARVPRGPLHRRRPDDDDGAAHPAPHRPRRRRAARRGLPRALRGAPRPSGRAERDHLAAFERRTA